MSPREQILRIVRDRPGLTATQIAEAVGKPYYIVEPVLNGKMIPAGQLVREQNPEWRGNGPTPTSKWLYHAAS